MLWDENARFFILMYPPEFASHAPIPIIRPKWFTISCNLQNRILKRVFLSLLSTLLRDGKPRRPLEGTLLRRNCFKNESRCGLEKGRISLADDYFSTYTRTKFRVGGWLGAGGGQAPKSGRAIRELELLECPYGPTRFGYLLLSYAL